MTWDFENIGKIIETPKRPGPSSARGGAVDLRQRKDIAPRATHEVAYRHAAASCCLCGHAMLVPESCYSGEQCDKCTYPQVIVGGEKLRIAEYKREGRLVTIRAILPEHPGLEGWTCDLIDAIEERDP